MFNLISSIILYPIAFCVFIIIGLSFIIISILAPVNIMHKFSKFVCWICLKSLGVRIKVEGQQPRKGGYIYMFNHSSFIDVFLFGYCTNSPCTAIIAEENYKYPIWSSMLKKYKAIPIKRQNKQSAIESIRKGEKLLRLGYNIVILPEGTRTITGNMKRFKKGGFHMAYNTKASIVPVGCIGAFEFKPKNRWTISPRTVTIKYGDKIDGESYSLLGIDGLKEKTENEIQRLTNGKFEDE